MLALTAVGAYLTGRRREARQKAIELETSLREVLDDLGVFPSPSVDEVDREHIEAALSEAIPNYDDSATIETVYADGRYLAPAAADVWLLADLAGGVSWLPYRPERFDCEQFARGFGVLSALVAGTNTVGVIHDWSGRHAYNVIVTAEQTVQFYDPYEGEFVAIGGTGKYRLENALILF
ncbi:hypothetical protein C5C07_15375 [Haloferax sp. Atlit-4N]|nr:hypothetical protein C5C07_15375 [Haloferax sp. Atlit-4N]